jgi:hypothetical protein
MGSADKTLMYSLYLKTIKGQETEIQGLHPAHPILDIFLRGFSLSSCPQQSLKVLLLLNSLCPLKYEPN